METLGEEHISTMDTRHLIGHCYMKQNKYENALQMLDTVLGMQKKVLGDDHVNTMMTMSTIGGCCLFQLFIQLFFIHSICLFIHSLEISNNPYQKSRTQVRNPLEK